MLPECYFEQRTQSIVTFIPEKDPQWYIQKLGQTEDLPVQFRSEEEQRENEARIRLWPRLTLYVPLKNSDVSFIAVQYDPKGQPIQKFYLESKSTGSWQSMGYDHIVVNQKTYVLNLKNKELQIISQQSATVIFKLVEISELDSILKQPDNAPAVTMEPVENVTVPTQPSPDWNKLKAAFQKRANRFFQNREKKQELLAGCEKLQDVTQLTDHIHPNDPNSQSLLSMFNRHRHTPRHNHYFARSLEPLVRDHALLQTPHTLKLWLDGYIHYLEGKSNGAEKRSNLQTATEAAWERYKDPQDANKPDSLMNMLTYAANPGDKSILDTIMEHRKTMQGNKKTAGYKALLKQFPTLPRDLGTSSPSVEMKAL